MERPGQVAKLVIAQSPFTKVAGLIPGQGTYKNQPMALADVAHWTESWPENQSVTSLIPTLGHMSVLWARSQVGGRKKQPHMDVSLPRLLPPVPSLKNK